MRTPVVVKKTIWGKTGWALVVGLWGLGFCFAGCNGAGSPPSSSEAAGLDLLSDQEWRLELFGADPESTPPISGPEITLQLTPEGKVFGSGGCNRYQGSFKRKGPDEISFGAIASTRMACPEEIMVQEDRYIKLLGKAKRFSLEGDFLRLMSEGEVLIYKAAGAEEKQER